MIGEAPERPPDAAAIASVRAEGAGTIVPFHGLFRVSESSTT
jgi:hypothetical protein